jgi:hypothetical protein
MSVYGHSYSQNFIPLDDNFSIEITEVTYKKSVTGTLQLVVAKTDHKILTFEVVLYSKSKKREQLDLNQMKLVSIGEVYQVVTQQGLGVWNSATGLFLKVKEEKKIKLYAQVKDDFKDGQLTFNGKDIYQVSVSTNSQNATFKPVN